VVLEDEDLPSCLNQRLGHRMLHRQRHDGIVHQHDERPFADELVLKALSADRD
jgi:hypothetical protein